MRSDYKPGVVSVIVPTFNRADLIVESLDSVWQQTYRPIELLIVDDGSTDDTAAVVRDWMSAHADDSQFQTSYIPRANAGAPAARNFGAQTSCGEFIQFLDSDDILHPEKLYAQTAPLLADSRLDFTWTEYASFSENIAWDDITARVYGRACDALLATHIKAGARMTTVSVVYRRDLCVRVGPWHESLKIWQDWEFNLRCLLRCKGHLHVPRVLAGYREHAGERISVNFHARQVKAAIEAVSIAEGILEYEADCGSDVREAIASRWRGLMLTAARLGLSQDIAAISPHVTRWSCRRFDRYGKLALYGISACPSWARPTLCSGLMWVSQAARRGR